MKTILAPTDFSPVSYNACLYAARMAEEMKAKLLLLHVMELPVAVAEFPMSENVFDQISMEEELNQLKSKLAAETNNSIQIETRNILGGIEHEIEEISKAINPFAVVMGTHSYSMADRFFLGSTTIYAAKHLRCPVLIIPSKAKYKPIRKVALASDLRDIYEVPVQEIEMLVKNLNAEFDVFYVAKNKNNIHPNALGGLLLNHRLENLNPEFYFIDNEDILKGVKSLSEKHATDMLIVIPKKHGPFHKSQSKDFIFYSDIPVLAIHENDMLEQV